MGTFVYGSDGTEVVFDDRLLAHLRSVIIAKLKRDESFSFSWDLGGGDDGARETVWVDASIQMRFVFSDEERSALSREWVDLLMRSANSSDGLRVVPEPVSSLNPTV